MPWSLESVHTPPRRPVAAGDILASRSHLTGDSAPRRASRWTELMGRWGRRASVPRAREYFHSLEECKILTRIPHRTACFNFNNYWIGERRKVEEVSLERSAKGLRRGTRSAVLPVFPRPAAQRVPQTARKAVAAAASHPLQDAGAPGLRQKGGSCRPPGSPERSDFGFLPSKGGSPLRSNRDTRSPGLDSSHFSARCRYLEGGGRESR